MKIAVVGLGLIGGSICKCLKKRTSHFIMGIESNKEIMKKALDQNAVDKEISVYELNEADLTIISLYPEAICKFVAENADRFKSKSVVTDTCGIKSMIVNTCTPVLKEKNVLFVGAHPMAGREFSGFDYSRDDLFDKASFIITPSENTPQNAVELLSELAKEMGFAKVVCSTPEKHDKIIAYTSQLAHIVSNAYVKSPTLSDFSGFSAGSFADLTRVAKLNEDMWTDLFMNNKSAILDELNCIIENITKYKSAIENDDAQGLRELLKEGRILKERTSSL